MPRMAFACACVDAFALFGRRVARVRRFGALALGLAFEPGAPLHRRILEHSAGASHGADFIAAVEAGDFDRGRALGEAASWRA